MKYPIGKYHSYQDLPFDQLNLQRCSIYIIDYNWSYMFANTYAIEQLGGINPTGKNIKTVWKEHSRFNFEPVYNLLKENVADRKTLDVKSRSPVTKKAIEIVGHPLTDCYYFSVYELPDKETLISELKGLLRKK